MSLRNNKDKKTVQLCRCTSMPSPTTALRADVLHQTSWPIYTAVVLSVIWATIASLINFLFAADTLWYTAQLDCPPLESSVEAVVCMVSFKHWTMRWKPEVPVNRLSVSRSFLKRASQDP